MTSANPNRNYDTFSISATPAIVDKNKRTLLGLETAGSGNGFKVGFERLDAPVNQNFLQASAALANQMNTKTGIASLLGNTAGSSSSSDLSVDSASWSSAVANAINSLVVAIWVVGALIVAALIVLILSHCIKCGSKDGMKSRV